MKAWSALAVGCSMVWASFGGATILPPNNLNLEDNLFRRSNVTEAKFNELIDQMVVLYSPLFEGHNAKLEVDRRWDDPTVNASAQKMGDTWLVSMYGGLARRPEVTPDAFTMVICHEIGHHLAGFPFYEGSPMATEGQADYFATQSCAKLVWGDQAEANVKYRNAASSAIKTHCDAIYSNDADQNLCYRSVLAGESLARLLLALEEGEQIDIDTPSMEKAPVTVETHPPAQCRLDTFLAGSVCDVEFSVNDIPSSWASARQVSCASASGHSNGLRPLCWFAPPNGER